MLFINGWILVAHFTNSMVSSFGFIVVFDVRKQICVCVAADCVAVSVHSKANLLKNLFTD